MRPSAKFASTAVLAALLSACAASPPPRARAGRVPPVVIRADPPLAQPAWDALLASAAEQVRRCYRRPQVSFAGRQIITRLRIALTAGGLIEGRPTVVEQVGVTPANRLYAPRMAEAAIQAVVRCAPLRLPDGFAMQGRLEIDLTFSPLAAA